MEIAAKRLLTQEILKGKGKKDSSGVIAVVHYDGTAKTFEETCEEDEKKCNEALEFVAGVANTMALPNFNGGGCDATGLHPTTIERYKKLIGGDLKRLQQLVDADHEGKVARRKQGKG